MRLTSFLSGKLTSIFFVAALFIVTLAACAQLEELNAPRLEPEPATETVLLTDEAKVTPTPFYLVATPTPAPSPVAVPTPVTPLLATGTPFSGTPTPTAAPNTQPVATDIPTATPGPADTPQAQPTVVPATPTPLPTPAPQPTGVKRVVLDEGVFLDVSPENAVSGRTVSFSVSGLPPWEPVTLSFNDPAGVRATWITSEDVHLVNGSDFQATTLVMYPNGSGELSWERYATQDATGDWTLGLDLAANVYRSTYAMEDLKLNDFEQVLLGTLLTRRDAGNFVIYYSELIPKALVIDLQEHLSDTVLLLDRKIQTETKQIPDIYLLGNREIMDKVSTFTGINLGFEDGYYTDFGERRGIYMRTDLLETEVRRLLTHEYVHHIFGGLSGNRNLPAWLTEGLAEYYEFDIALSGPRPQASELRLYISADLARTAAQNGTLLSLDTLDSQSDWNSRTGDDVPLQYATGYMAVRFLIETYGSLAGKDVLVTMAGGSNLSDALNTVTGLDLGLFELQFTRWLAKWEDPERKALAEYITALQVILTAETANSHLRAQNLQASMTYEETVNSHAFLVQSTEALIQDLKALSPPERAMSLHHETDEHFGRVLVWLSLELQAAEAFDNGPLIAANNMIPEINARDFNLNRNFSNLQFVLNLAG